MKGVRFPPIDREAFTRMKQFSTLDLIAAKSSPVACQAHNLDVVGSNPTAATLSQARRKTTRSPSKKNRPYLEYFNFKEFNSGHC